MGRSIAMQGIIHTPGGERGNPPLGVGEGVGGGDGVLISVSAVPLPASLRLNPFI